MQTVTDELLLAPLGPPAVVRPGRSQKRQLTREYYGYPAWLLPTLSRLQEKRMQLLFIHHQLQKRKVRWRQSRLPLIVLMELQPNADASLRAECLTGCDLEEH